MKNNFTKEFQEFWNHVSGKVQAYMFCACGNVADADDMAQDCFLRALQAWNQFNGKASRQAWLFGIARRTRVDWLRNKTREKIKAEAQKFVQQKEAADGQANINDVDKVWKAVKNPNEDYKDVIHLRFAAGLSYDQIAHALEIPLGTVRSRLHRGLKAIKENVGDRENGS